MDANEKNDTVMFELNNKVFCDAEETEEEPEGFLFHHDTDSGDIPPSLLSYFESSKSRAAVCEKLILEELEDFPALHHSEDMMNSPFELDKDTMKPNEQIICDPENEENNTSSDTRLLTAPTETHNVSVCPNNEDEAESEEYVESERQFLLELEAEREKRRCEEMKQEEQKRRIERDFQRELKKIMEAEKLQQRELELMGRRAQEKLEEELLLQQELMNNLKRRVEEERRMREEQQKRIKDAEEKRKREEEKVKIEAERKRMEEERRKKEEEQKRIKDAEEKRKREEEKVKIEAERKRMEEERRTKKEEERKIKELKLRKEQERIREEEEKRRRDALEKKKLEDELRMMEGEERKNKKEEEERIKKEEEEKRKREEERRKIEAARGAIEKEKRRMEEEMSQKKEQERKKKEEEEALKKTYEEMKERDERKYVNADEGMKLDERKKKEEKDRKRREEDEEEREEARQRDNERQKIDEKEVKEVVRKEEGEKEEPKPIKEDEKRKMKEEEGMRRQNDEMRRENEEQYRTLEEEITLKKDEQHYKELDVDNREMAHESKPKDNHKEKNLAKEEVRKSIIAEKKLNEEEVNKETEEEIRVKVKEERKKREVHDRETGEIVIKANELQEKREDETENTVASQVAGSSTCTSSSSGCLHSESTNSPTSPESVPQQHDPEDNTSQTSTDKTVDCENRAARPSVPPCLPEHTEEKRLSWMEDCIPWSKLSLQNRRKQTGSVRGRRALRGAAEGCSLPPLCTGSLLQSAGWKSLQEVTTVTLEDLPGCSLSTLSQCARLQSLSLRRCGLRSLEGINQLPQLCYIDVQENDISFIDCENMSSLRVLQLAHNKLTSIHGLNGAENLDVLDLSHNSITRIAGLESVRRLQRLSVDHNQLISTKGLRDVYTLLHLNCSHNHLARVEGLENSALLNTLDLRANSLTEPPSLNNQVLLTELHLDDNSISSLQGLTACWLPLMQHLSVAQNRITRLPSMSDFVSLANLDLRYNCMSELQNVCESLQGCLFLREVHLTGNPLQQESGWSSALQKAVPGLRASGDQQTDSFLAPPAAPQVSSASGSFLRFCQAQLQQTQHLQQQHSRELSKASSSLDAVKTCCRHLSEALQLAKEQRFAHEYGDTTVADKHNTAGQRTPEETLDVDGTNAVKRTEHTDMDFTRKAQPVLTNSDKCSYRTGEGKLAVESQQRQPGSVHSSQGKSTSSSLKMSPVSNHQDLVIRNTAAVVIQQLWRKYRQKCGNISSVSTAERGGGGGPESGPSFITRSVVGRDHAATVIQALWRGFALRRRLASALAAVTFADSVEDDTFEEVDVDEFVFDEAAIERPWTLSFSEDSPPRRYTVTEQLPSLKPPVHFPEPSQYFLPPPPVRRPKQAWAPEEQVNSAGHRVSPESCNRSKSPASTSVLSGLSERSEKILEEWGFADSHTALQMLKRAQNMKSAKQQQKKRRDPSVRLALFRNCNYRLGPVEARNRPAQPKRNNIKVGEAELGLQQAERGKQRLHTQAAHSDRDPESERFLPEISSDILNGGRVQLVADPGYTERLHHASGLRANSSAAAQPCKENNYPRRNSLGHAKKEVSSPQRVQSAPSKKERISFRDNPVRMSNGWGGGKKRDKVHK